MQVTNTCSFCDQQACYSCYYRCGYCINSGCGHCLLYSNKTDLRACIKCAVKCNDCEYLEHQSNSVKCERCNVILCDECYDLDDATGIRLCERCTDIVKHNRKQNEDQFEKRLFNYPKYDCIIKTVNTL